MNKTRMIMIMLAILAVMTSACAKKAVETQPVAATPPPVVQPAPQPAPVGPDPAQQQRAAALNRFLNEYVYFDFDSAVLRPDAQAILRDKVQFIESNADLGNLIIEGHCDERGTDAYNMALGARRADSVKQFMVKMGLPAAQFEVMSFGEERPIDPGHNETAWAKNRRAAFVQAK